jgi:hypothetical protein
MDQISSPFRFVVRVFAMTFRNLHWALLISLLFGAVTVLVGLLWPLIRRTENWWTNALSQFALLLIVVPLWALGAVLWHRVVLTPGQIGPARKLPLLRYSVGLFVTCTLTLPVLLGTSYLQNWFRGIGLQVLQVDINSFWRAQFSVFMTGWVRTLLISVYVPIVGLFLPGIALGQSPRLVPMFKGIYRMFPSILLAVVVIIFAEGVLFQAVQHYVGSPFDGSFQSSRASAAKFLMIVIQALTGFLLLSVMSEAWRQSFMTRPTPERADGSQSHLT